MHPTISRRWIGAIDKSCHWSWFYFVSFACSLLVGKHVSHFTLVVYPHPFWFTLRSTYGRNQSCVSKRLHCSFICKIVQRKQIRKKSNRPKAALVAGNCVKLQHKATTKAALVKVSSTDISKTTTRENILAQLPQRQPRVGIITRMFHGTFTFCIVSATKTSSFCLVFTFH